MVWRVDKQDPSMNKLNAPIKYIYWNLLAGKIMMQYSPMLVDRRGEKAKHKVQIKFMQIRNWGETMKQMENHVNMYNEHTQEGLCKLEFQKI